MTTNTRRDDLYFFDDIYFNAEDCIFKVPERMFHFSERLSALIKSSKGRRGGSECTAIELKAVREGDFRNFLLVLIPFPSGPNSFAHFSVTQWVSVLGFSTDWGFSDVRAQAIKVLLSGSATITPAEKVRVGERFNVGALFRQGCRAIIQRGERISDEEADSLGYEIAYRLNSLLVQKYKDRDCSETVGPKEIDDAFEKLLERIDREDATYGAPISLPEDSMAEERGGYYSGAVVRQTKRARM